MTLCGWFVVLIVLMFAIMSCWLFFTEKRDMAKWTWEREHDWDYNLDKKCWQRGHATLRSEIIGNSVFLRLYYDDQEVTVVGGPMNPLGSEAAWGKATDSAKSLADFIMESRGLKYF